MPPHPMRRAKLPSRGPIRSAVSSGAGGSCARRVAAALVVLLASCSLAAPSDEDLVGSCQDGLRNGGETDVDCGGPADTGCGACGVGRLCREARDCTSAVCDGTSCGVGDCGDGVKNGAETDIDCGGNECLVTCLPGQGCKNDFDCDYFCVDGKCTDDTCIDGRKSGDESDVDCGGSLCDGCGLGEKCGVDFDCSSGKCENDACATASCTDMRLNGDESDTDCGGSNPACPRCGAGKYCYEDTDCAAPLTCNDASGTCM